MGEQYSHTLIASRKDFTPLADQVEIFLTAMVEKQVLPGVPKEIMFRTLSGQFREFPIIDPWTGRNLKLEVKNTKRLSQVSEIAEAAKQFPDYEVMINGFGKPQLVPLSIEFEQPYSVSIACFVYSAPRSTSDPHAELVENNKIIPPHGRMFPDLPQDGFYEDPNTGDIIKVPNAGSARFWIRFELGKFLFPKWENGSLEILNPKIVAEAENVFGIKFLQGCCWFD